MTKHAEIFTAQTDQSPPLEVAVVIAPEAALLTLGSVIDPLRAANRHLGRDGFHWRIASLDGQPVPLTCGVRMPVDLSLAALAEEARSGGADVVVMLAGYGSRVMAQGRVLADLARSVRGAGLCVAVDSGGWFLAAAGLLEDVRVTTHWEDLEDFEARHPSLHLVPDRYVIDGRIASAAGAGPAQDLMLDLIAARHGAALAMQVAGTFITTRRSGSESQLAALAAGRATGGDPRVTAAIARMETRLETPEPVAETAAAVGLSLRRLQALFAREIGMSPKEYALELRLQAARRLILDTRAPLAEIALRCGFPAQSALSRACRQRFGSPPSALRRH